MKQLTALVLITGFLTFNATAQEPEDNAPAAEPAQNCSEAITVFQDVSGMGRKDRAAKNMSQKHRKMAETGWRFADMEVYTENGDLEGFYLTYKREAPCLPASH